MTTPSTGRLLPGWLIIVACMSALGPVSIDMYLPAFPAIEREFSQQGVEQTMAMYLLGLAFGQVVYGPVSDALGRKRPLYVGLGIYALSSVGCALSANMPMLVTMRLLQGLGACAPLVISRAIVRDRCLPHEAARVYSVLMMIVSVGPIIAPTLGAALITVASWRATFILQAVFAFALLLAMHLVLEESSNSSQRLPMRIASVVRTYVRLLLDRTLVCYSLAGAFAIASLFCYVAGSATVLATAYGLSPQEFGWVIGLNGIALMAASRMTFRALRESTPAELLAKAIWQPLIVAAVFVTLAYLIEIPLWLVVTLQFCFFLTVGRVAPNISALALAPHARQAGSASALLGSVQSALGMVAGLAVSFVNDSLFALALLMAAGVVLSALSYLIAMKLPPQAD